MHDAARERALGRLLLAAFLAFWIATFAPHFALSAVVWAIVMLVYAIAVSAIALWLARLLSVRFRIIAMAICYVGLTIIFGSVHYLVFARDQTSYIFADAIGAQQSETTLARASNELADTEIQLAVIRELSHSSLRSNVPLLTLRDGDPVTLSKGTLVQLRVETYHAPMSPPFTSHRLLIRRGTHEYYIQGDRIGDARSSAVLSLCNATTLTEMHRALSDLAIALRQYQQHVANRLSARRPVWEYTDFLYFSGYD